MRRTLNMTEERMSMIDKEITASNARKFGTSSSARAHFSKSTPINGTQRRRQTSSIIEYQQHVGAVTTEKTRRFYTFYDVQAERRFIKNTSKTFDEKWGNSKCQITYYTYSRRTLIWR